MSVSFLSKWPICSRLDQATIASIKKVYVFGDSGEVIFITKDDEVFAFGANSNGCLGLGDTTKRDKPHKIEILCKKQIVIIACGYDFVLDDHHMLAVTASGTVFCWGKNDCGQLGIGNMDTALSPVQVTNHLTGITQVACGGHLSVALNADGEIFAWGRSIMPGGNNASVPTKVIIGKAISIACGWSHIVALLHNGEVYGWGYNTHGEFTYPTEPCKVQALYGVLITQVVCGYNHTLALSAEKKIYSWGGNDQGQLGTGDRDDKLSPFQIKLEERFIEIAATQCSATSAGLTETGKVYVWGQCSGQSITSPFLTGFSTTDAIFAIFPIRKVMWRVYSVDENPDRTMAGDIAKSFDDSTRSDITFIVDGKPIHCHKAILRVRCDHFEAMFQKHWDEDKNDSIEVPYSYPVYRAFLYFLYTDTVDLDAEGAIGLLELANSYCEKVLKRQCEQIIKQGITIENAAMLYAAAIKFEANELEDFCFKFAKEHIAHVTQTEAFVQLDKSIMCRLIQKAFKK